MEVNSSSVKSSRQASMSGCCVLHCAQVELKRNVAVDGDKLFREQNSVAVLLEGFAIGFTLDLVA